MIHCKKQGLYDVAADGALACDTAHRFMSEVLGGEMSKIDDPQLALSKVDEVEKDPSAFSPTFNWLDKASHDTMPSHGKNTESFNFNNPEEYHTARQQEISDRNLELRNTLEDEKRGTYPETSLLKDMIRNDAIRVAKNIIANAAGMDGGAKRKRGDDGLVS